MPDGVPVTSFRDSIFELVRQEDSFYMRATWLNFRAKYVVNVCRILVFLLCSCVDVEIFEIEKIRGVRSSKCLATPSRRDSAPHDPRFNMLDIFPQ